MGGKELTCRGALSCECHVFIVPDVDCSCLIFESILRLFAFEASKIRCNCWYEIYFGCISHQLFPVSRYWHFPRRIRPSSDKKPLYQTSNSPRPSGVKISLSNGLSLSIPSKIDLPKIVTTAYVNFPLRNMVSIQISSLCCVKNTVYENVNITKGEYSAKADVLF